MIPKARWFSPSLDAREAAPDPFSGGPEDIPQGEPEWTALEFDREDAELRLRDLLEREMRLADDGVRCPIRQMDGTVCSLCPLSAHADPLDPRHALCVLGREQERIVTLLAAATKAPA